MARNERGRISGLTPVGPARYQATTRPHYPLQKVSHGTSPLSELVCLLTVGLQGHHDHGCEGPVPGGYGGADAQVYSESRGKGKH